MGETWNAEDRLERWSNCETRLNDLSEFLHRRSTQSLRTRWCEELAAVHADLLHDRKPEQAEGLKLRLDAHLNEYPPGPSPSALVKRQVVAWARVCLGGVRYRVEHGRDHEARVRMSELLMRARAVADCEDGAVVLACALELAHGVEQRIGLVALADEHLEHLQLLEEAYPLREVREPLARALASAVRAELDVGREDFARRHVATLRTMAARGLASEPQRTMLSEALLALHHHAEAFERAQLEGELELLANRAYSVQDQRNAWMNAIGRSGGRDASDLPWPKLPLELLRDRAYRGNLEDARRVLFDRLEADLLSPDHSFSSRIATFNELRTLAERPGADRSLRLRFARPWLELRYDARRYDYGAVANDRAAYAWVREAAERGDPDGRVLLGRCLAAGRGTERNRREAARLWRRAAAEGSDEAHLLLRTLGTERFPWLRHRYTVLLSFGMAMLVLHLLTQPFVFNPLGVLAYLGLQFAVIVGLGFVRAWRERSSAGSSEPADSHRYIFGKMLQNFESRPWRILRVVTEDGFSLAPLMWLGVNPWTATALGLIFGLAHYPQYSLRVCLRLGAVRTAVALLIFPWAGLWAVAMGHVLYDVLLYMWGRTTRS